MLRMRLKLHNLGKYGNVLFTVLTGVIWKIIQNGLNRINTAASHAPIKIGDCEIPAPERVAPAVGSKYWIVGISHGDCLVEELEWDDDASDNFFLKKGIVHLNPESAVAHGEALIALTAIK